VLRQVEDAAWPSGHPDRRPIAEQVGAGEPTAGRPTERIEHGEDMVEREIPGIPVDRRVFGRQHVLVDGDVQWSAGEVLAIRFEEALQAVGEWLAGVGKERIAWDSIPPEPAEPPAGRNDPDAARTQLPPWGEGGVMVVEVEVATDVEHAAEVGKLKGSGQPGTAVKEWDAANPVGVFVEDEQVKRVGEPPEQCEGDVMKIPGAEQDEPRPLACTKLQRRLLLKLSIDAEATRHSDPRPPGTQVGDPRGLTVAERALGREAAVQIKDVQVESGQAHPGIVGRTVVVNDTWTHGAFA
jgi:hypothetical protein